MISLKQDVCWGEMDAFGHINNTVYFKYFENARIKYFEDTGILKLMKENNIGPIMAQADCQFIKPIKYPDLIEVKAKVSLIKNSSFIIDYELFSQSLNDLAASGSSVIVMVDYNTGKKVAVPEKIKSNIKISDNPTCE